MCKVFITADFKKQPFHNPLKWAMLISHITMTWLHFAFNEKLMHPLQTYDPMPAKLLTWTFLCCQKGIPVGFGCDFQEGSWSTSTKHFFSEKTLLAHRGCTKGFYRHNCDNRNSTVKRRAENLPKSPWKNWVVTAWLHWHSQDFWHYHEWR